MCSTASMDANQDFSFEDTQEFVEELDIDEVSLEDTEEDVATCIRASLPSEYPTAITPALQVAGLREALRRAEAAEIAATTTLVGHTMVIAELRRASGMEEPDLQSAVFTLTKRAGDPAPDKPTPLPFVKPSSLDDTVRIRVVRKQSTFESVWAMRYELASGALLVASLAFSSWLVMHR